MILAEVTFRPVGLSLPRAVVGMNLINASAEEKQGRAKALLLNDLSFGRNA